MAVLKRSGGFVALFWQGKIPDPREEAFCEALAERRFRTIENAASEETSVGWVTPALPTGDEFTPEDLDAGAATWLRMRIDKKVLPKKWLAVHLESEERARGKKLPPRERRELKQDIGEKLLPRVLPTINLVDALMFHERKTILLFGTSNAVIEAFGKLFFETFALPLDRANPYQCATRLGLDRDLVAGLDRLQPIRWPDVTGGDQPARRELPSVAPAAPVTEMPAAAEAGVEPEVVPFELDEEPQLEEPQLEEPQREEPRQEEPQQQEPGPEEPGQ
ncbi:MAG: recombination-associated protein RdgC [bacterium]|nr:recombination-associated protein RdgC [bacterium]